MSILFAYLFTILQASFQDQTGVTAVSVTGEPDRYLFEVTLRTADKGCEQYADWWEVVTPDGELIYRRILAHSHVTEQPFTRSGSPVKIAPETSVIVRFHMNNTGYNKNAMMGTVKDGFEKVELNEGFAATLADKKPLPTGCAF